MTAQRPCILYTMDGKQFASTSFVDAANRWPWIKTQVADLAGCGEEEIDIIETNDGDRITAQGKIVAYSSSGVEPHGNPG